MNLVYLLNFYLHFDKAITLKNVSATSCKMGNLLKFDSKNMNHKEFRAEPCFLKNDICFQQESLGILEMN